MDVEKIESVGRKRKLKGIWRLIFIACVLLGIIMNIFQVFQWSYFGEMISQYPYMFSIFSCFVAPVFLTTTPRKSSLKDKIPWFDMVFFFLALSIPAYFSLQGLMPVRKGWEFTAPPLATILASIEVLLIIEGCRRVAGKALTVLTTFFLLFPLYCSSLPGLLSGISYSAPDLVRFLTFSREGLQGIATVAFGSLLIGFMTFGIVVKHAGGGDFFSKLANALVGHTRGGPAKVAVVSSSLFGTISGSTISNVLVDGYITIPAMKGIGFSPEYAAATEACASTGGALMPPVMGAAAFIMAEFLGIPYVSVCLAALVPSVLYYMSLFIQLDLYSLKKGIIGLPKEKLPSLFKTLVVEGWIYYIAVAILMYFLAYQRVEELAPYYAIGALLVMTMLNKRTRLGMHKFVAIIEDCGMVLVDLMVMIAAIGFIIGSMSMTGVGVALPSGLVDIARGNIYLLLIMGAFISMILGMGLPSVPVYVFLSLTLAPALVTVGIYPLAAHLFVLYFGILSFITPPVALAAYAAAGVGGADPLKTGWVAMRLGSVKYILPFFFCLQPALILHGSVPLVTYSILTSLIGVFFLAAGLEGFFWKIGFISWPVRIGFILGGFVVVLPEWRTDLIGAIVLIMSIYVAKSRINRSKSRLPKR